MSDLRPYDCPPIPADEAQRLLALRSLGVLDTPAEERFDRLTRLALHFFNVPMALVSLVDSERQWLKSHQGIAERETAREISFCGHAILGDDIFEVPDTTLDARFAANPLVTGELNNIRFYAGVPLYGQDGYCVGVFCIKDRRPRLLSADERRVLRDLADCAQSELQALQHQLTEWDDLSLHLLDPAQRRSGFAMALERLLKLSVSAYGFIGEVLHDDNGQPYLKAYALTDIAWDEATHALYSSQAAQGMEFRNLNTLFGAAIRSGAPVFANDPAHDPRSGGLPSGHPALNAFLGIPIFYNEQLVGLVGLANRPGGYTPALLDFLQPLLQRIGLWIAASRNAEQLRLSQERLADLERVAHIGCWHLNLQTGRLQWSDELYRLFGLEPRVFAASYAAFLERIHPDDRAAVDAAYQSSLQAGQPSYRSVHRIVRANDGAVRYMYEQCQHRRNEAGAVLESFGTAQDVTERELAAQALRRAASVFEHANDAIVITDACGTIVDANAAQCRISGYERSELLGQNPRLWASGRHDKVFYQQMWQALHQQGLWRGEIWNRRKSGAVYPALLTISPVRDTSGRLQGYAGISSDLSTLREQERQVERLSQYDALTGLPNRSLLADRLLIAMGQAIQHQRQLAVVYLDLDGFKAYNDQLGHEAGDQLLIALGHSLQSALRPGDTLARMGGDEFVAVLPDLSSALDCLPVLEALLAAATCPGRSLPAQAVHLSASLGVSFYPQADAVDADQLLRQADQAMFQAKQSGKNRYHFFDTEGDRGVRSRHAEIERIALGLKNHEFVLFYQPKVNMHSGDVIGAEALIRWQHPQLGLQGPGTFLPALGQQPLMVNLGDWVLEQALQQISEWHRAGLHLPVSVNVDALQLAQPDFVPKLRAALARHPDVQPSLLELEVLETSALGDLGSVSALLHQCRELGVLTSLDDFGTGYSSLTYLKHLPTQVLKIDQSFVRSMLDDPTDIAILQGVLGLARALGRLVIAEGVETSAHAQMLLRLGCLHGQGYAIARPMPAALIPAWVAQWRPDPAWVAAIAAPSDPAPGSAQATANSRSDAR
jgi:diguanylate cyclase (GGDEF)-like protein/PAS domain S-box-containing protein